MSCIVFFYDYLIGTWEGEEEKAPTFPPVPPKPLAQARDAHLLVQREQVRRPQKTPEASPEKWSHPREHGPAVQAGRLFRGERRPANNVARLFSCLENQQCRLESKRRCENSLDGRRREGDPHGAQDSSIKKQRREQEEIQERGGVEGSGMFIIREGAGHEAGDEGDTCRSNGHAVEARWSMVSCPECDEDQLESSEATCDRL